MVAEPSQDGEKRFGLALPQSVGMRTVYDNKRVLDVEWFCLPSERRGWRWRCRQVDAGVTCGDVRRRRRCEVTLSP
jgi:hypothetical protein